MSKRGCIDCDDGPCYMNCGPAVKSGTDLERILRDYYAEPKHSKATRKAIEALRLEVRDLKAALAVAEEELREERAANGQFGVGA